LSARPADTTRQDGHHEASNSTNGFSPCAAAFWTSELICIIKLPPAGCRRAVTKPVEVDVLAVGVFNDGIRDGTLHVHANSTILNESSNTIFLGTEHILGYGF
jgi:hypothetical protein